MSNVEAAIKTVNYYDGRLAVCKPENVARLTAKREEALKEVMRLTDQSWRLGPGRWVNGQWVKP